ncbi:MAG: polyamine ABC transporter substrate-binding protein [Chromatiales bacterium]|jgi:putative spermidine/putrescine transport system substrate-binding protein|nr:polyamine ABC transporter substrate-binding protein [Chromatiales bacterium]
MKRAVVRLDLAVAGALALTVGAAQATDLTITSWGGAYTASQQKAYGERWEKQTGKKIHWEHYNGGLDEIKNQVESGKVTWDIVDVLAHEARVGCDEGLFEEIPEKYLVKTRDGRSLDDDLMVPRPNKCVAPMIWWSYLAFYDQRAWDGRKAPRSIADFFNVDDFPGKRGIHTWPNALIEMALLADGVEPARMYEVLGSDAGIDRAFKKLDQIRDHVVFWSSGAKPLELVRSGVVSISTAYNGRVGAAILSEGASFVPIWDSQVLEGEWIAVVKGSPNKESAFEFVGYATAPEQQARQARYINYGPMRASAFDIIKAGEPWFHNGKTVMEHMPNRPDVMSRSILANPEWWADNGASIKERFETWKAKG